MAIYRAFEVDRPISQGLLYPRLAMDFNFTYGAPLLQYRPPLVHYVIPIFHWVGLGWIDAAKLTASIELLLASIGMYVYARWLFQDRRAALVSAAAYLFAPYLLLDIQERGAISEAAALAVLPWLFWALHHTLETELRCNSGIEARLWPWLGALLTALLVLAHNIIALFAVPVLLLYLCLLAWRRRSWRQITAVLIALGAGLGLSAFYWMPALLERSYAQIESRMLDASPDSLLSPLGEWIQLQLAFDFWGPLRFRLSLWQTVVAVIAIIALAATALDVLLPTPSEARDLSAQGSANDPRWAAPTPSSGLHFVAALLAAITVGVMLLQLDASRPFWNLIPLVRFIQFPWRLLGIASFCIALLAGFLFTWAGPRFWRGRWEPHLTGSLRWIAAAGFLGIVLYAGTFRLAPQFYPYYDQISEDTVNLTELSERGRSWLSIFSDFLPAGVKVDPEDLTETRLAPDSRLLPMTYVPAITVISDRPSRLDLQVRSEQPFTLRLHRFFFPGWQVYAAGKPVPTGPSGDAGLVTADLPSGEYPVVVQFGQTPLRTLAGIVTLISLIAWIAVGISIPRARPILAAVGGILVLAVVLMVARRGAGVFRSLGAGEASRRPVSTTANFQDEIRLLGYQLPEKVWRPGDDLALSLYWLAQRTPAEDYKVFIHLIKPDDSARVAQSDSFPILGYSPTTRWEPGEIIVDEHQVNLDENVAPGKYLLLTGIYHPETVQNLPVSGAAKVLPGDRVVLTEIEVQAR
jgi:hypothetical protein